MFKKVIVGISGGVDSAVAALLLKNKGFNVTGVFMKNWDIADETGKCSVEEDQEHAQWVCNKLKIPLVEVNFVKEYWNNVFSYLIDHYEKGYTPNPDILCNKCIKFDKFFHFARTELQADAIATGHYVKTSFGPYLEHFKPDTNVCLFRVQDKKKDQTFFLCQVPQIPLRYSMFPLGEHLKSNVKQIALEAGLDVVAHKKESMGICFVGKRDFQSFISEYISDKPGVFIDLHNGTEVGTHVGFHHWTVGQRIKIPGCLKAFFVYKKIPETNAILVVQGTDHPALYSDLVVTGTPHWISEKPQELNSYSKILGCDFRFQHADSTIPCLIHQTINDQLVIRLSKPLRALTEGQFAVLYNGEECLGSAQIIRVGPSYYVLDKEVRQEYKQMDDTNEEQIVHAVV
ncbi:mitochondrial tRNA-specific 2-thiouridylase 1 isoform X1 [Hylaeus anthracinus]|uniref:mitochondrial tRNA-specific 2-thiouridylase 1 isoform X1 n=2 Tax=Hylaeus anthracinus TaxID=313031 RepID=UPI0023BA2081|nr:mitochondrial tRNA-specific 2-thiouridylase 1 isoform X1 [Hylaeus anthracinus]XP_054009644.1 mitochondrial tRNA-specific 2-thiouridylase 1 isoform X1 [Hylaeus anthracinus]XP_054009646.1 mitochondrial tRNA-specific 2-thiouridylase 1 isoform X1 [Hylaeus anthracinus]XP_054009647.1 mitochondrial tRNA-specific 2-thiouridylase 1 isoform X1 [Hylaeus anthracinus]XP_054009648.1 mitochondrial tRNA-specific 2-thiouridylase 1 isoform X1 [Hylaeus anthracinus]